MSVYDLLEDALDHFISKAGGTLIGGDFRGQILFEAEMYRLLGHGIAELHHARCHSRNGSLVCVGHRLTVCIDVEREIETRFRWRFDMSFQSDSRHIIRFASLYAPLFREDLPFVPGKMLPAKIISFVR